MNIDEYQREALKTAIYPGQGTIDGLIYVSLGLGEAGELQGRSLKLYLCQSFGIAPDQARYRLWNAN